ncbi:MAG: tetratricopeptide repeat protein [Pseudomonadota bacterium]|jgi:Flp pilus assembly protein TadD
MSLINDMLKDLEARKASSGQSPGEMAQVGERLATHIDGLRHTDVTPPIERVVRRHLSWLFWPFLLILLAVAAALYLLRSGNQAPMAGLGSVEELAGSRGETPPSGPEIRQAPSPASAPETVPPATPHSAPGDAEDEVRLVMLSAVDQGQALRLDLAFDKALREAVRLSRDGERVDLYLPGIRSATVERPHPSLREWQSQQAGEGWRLGFVWPSTADVRLQPRRSDDGLRHWELLLASPAPSDREAVPAPAKDGHGVPVAAGPAKKESPRAVSVPPKPASDKVAGSSPGLTPAQQAEALYAEAWQLQQKGRAELAMDKLRQAVQAQPEHVRARELLVRLLLRSGQPRAAEIELLHGLEIQPRQPELVELMARMLADQGRGQEALAFLRARMAADRLAHQALFAVLAARAGDHAVAAEAYRHAAELDPRDPRWPLGRAIALENSGQPATARAAYAQALGLEGLDAASRAFVQERLQQLGQGE